MKSKSALLTAGLDAALESDAFEESRRVLRIACLAFPLLYLSFWIVDLIFAPELRWLFLFIRLGALPIPIFIYTVLKKSKSYTLNQALACLYAFACSLGITFMIFKSSGISSAYYAGLNLVGIIALCFIPFQKRWFFLTTLTIYIPFLLSSLVIGGMPADWRLFIVNLSFILSTIVVSAILQINREARRILQIDAKLNLSREIDSREAIIKLKTQEGIKLASLSNQFSPQVVDAIRTGKITLAVGVRRSQICAMFIDIVNSTERVARVDKDKVHKVISLFMEDTIKTLLKFDLTIDKFLGDGILSFSNEPVQYNDFTDRAVNAALEIRRKIALNQDQYESYWMNALEIRIGIATGFANVGFYGDEKLYKSYTAIGPVVNLASRLCSAAEPNQILITQDAVDQLKKKSNVSTTYLGKKQLKGFELDIIKVHEIVSGLAEENYAVHDLNCSACLSGSLFLDNDPDGIMILKCRACGSVQNVGIAGNNKVA